jgi:hypothetical protein
MCLCWSEQCLLFFRRFCRWLHSNQLSGTMPSAVGQLSLLREL